MIDRLYKFSIWSCLATNKYPGFSAMVKWLMIIFENIWNWAWISTNVSLTSSRPSVSMRRTSESSAKKPRKFFWKSLMFNPLVALSLSVATYMVSFMTFWSSLKQVRMDWFRWRHHSELLHFHWWLRGQGIPFSWDLRISTVPQGEVPRSHNSSQRQSLVPPDHYRLWFLRWNQP